MSRTRDILARRHGTVIRKAARSNVLLAFDYDGTLSPIARRPDSARMPRSTRRLLTRVAAAYSCAVISGRALADIAARVDGTGVRYVFGNHGLESSLGRSRPSPEVRRWVARLARLLKGQAGILIEDKRHSVAVHFRAAPDEQAALQAVNEAISTLHDARIVKGLASVNLLPAKGTNKGTALRQALDASGCRLALYIGDDETDEDAFGALGAERLLAVRVGPSSTSKAAYHIDAQPSIDRFLQALIEARCARGGRADLP